VGIFFAYENQPSMDGTSVNDPQPYGDFKVHAKGHSAFSRSLQRNDLFRRGRGMTKWLGTYRLRR
jgi:hypothetical protein